MEGRMAYDGLMSENKEEEKPAGRMCKVGFMVVIGFRKIFSGVRAKENCLEHTQIWRKKSPEKDFKHES